MFGHLNHHRHLYNGALHERIDAYQKHGISIKYNDQQKSLTEIRGFDSGYKNIPVYSARMTLRRLDKAFKSFFRRVGQGQKPGFPRFKSRSRFKSFEMCKHGIGWKFIANDEKGKHGKLWIKGIGYIKARGKARHQGTVKSCTVKYDKDKWWVSVVIECEPTRDAQPTQSCGIDWGVEHLLTVTHQDGSYYHIDNPRWFQDNKEKLVELQQDVSRKKKGSNRWKKACKRLSRFHAKTARKRKEHHHQLSACLAERYALVASEELDIQAMSASAKGTEDNPGQNVRQKSGLNREILDTAPATLIANIRYKVEETGSWYFETPTKTLKPSQRCPWCWAVAQKDLDERTHDCAHCGLKMPRDAASSMVNILWALQQVAGREPAFQDSS